MGMFVAKNPNYGFWQSTFSNVLFHIVAWLFVILTSWSKKTIEGIPPFQKLQLTYHISFKQDPWPSSTITLDVILDKK